MRSLSCLVFALLPTLTATYVIHSIDLHNETENTTPDIRSPLIAQREEDASVSLDFVQRWAAIGDSFTAGIGSGSRMGLPPVHSDEWYCSRYTYTWPHMVDRAIGASKKDFQYPACSGARSAGIYNQANDLKGDLDVVMLTAGGNDLCLAAMISSCVMLAYDGEAACTQLIDKAQENIDTILKGNIRGILTALKPKMKQDGIVIYNGYAPFFNTENEDCADPKKQKWSLPKFWSWRYWFSSPLALTIDRRKKFNKLVDNINKAILEVVEEFQTASDKKFDIEFSDWGGWPAEVDGQMCSPSSDGHYPDPNQPELQFFKGNTWVRQAPAHDGLKRNEMFGENMYDLNGYGGDGWSPFTSEQHGDPEFAGKIKQYLQRMNMYDSLLYKSADPRAVVMHKLNPRAPSPPNCPGDEKTWGLGLPDTFGMNFHPNERGHESIAAFALQNLAYAKAKQDGKVGDVCEIDTDEFTCWQKEGRKAYVSWERLDTNHKNFCDKVKAPSNEVNWKVEETYYKGTPEEVQFVIQLSNDASSFDSKLCKESFDRIINSCDGNDPKNPLNWKFGGKYKRGSYTYEINPKKDRKLYTRTDGSCQGWYKVLWSSYTLYGHGWIGWDNGEALKNKAKDCVGGGLTKWEFEYYDNPDDHNGWEWRAFFRTPIWTNARCFDNLKAQGGAGGYTHKWHEDFEDEKYEEYGCTGSG
ncbi:hypothetical protein CI238_12144 [Colletotrichum incanum]|uniref:SGNH hydrolase-type esterase domain-containing protein n=1 Tax=Colletotrichum incanum TaxID=1573173 RepID=A0A166T4F2_COLIC|nr:hypothetical protein CI238_12144 [Colletotrichum incanum]